MEWDLNSIELNENSIGSKFKFNWREMVRKLVCMIFEIYL
jgi:hypothetical protein